MKLDIAAETESTIATLPRATYVSIACIARSRPSLQTTDPGAADPWRRSSAAWLDELLARFQPGSSIDDATEWLVEEPAPLRIARATGRGELRCIVHRSDTDLITVIIGVFAGGGLHGVPPEGADAGGDTQGTREHGLEGRMRKIRDGYEFTFSYGDSLSRGARVAHRAAISSGDTFPDAETVSPGGTPVHGDTPGQGDTPALDSPFLAQALRQLDAGLEKYVRVLAGFRGEYIHPLRITSRGEVMHLSRSVDEAKRREEIRQKQDEFLDAYIDWKSTHRIAERTKLLELARQLSELDPSFQFSTPD